jgi:hypothetical protein
MAERDLTSPTTEALSSEVGVLPIHKTSQPKTVIVTAHIKIDSRREVTSSGDGEQRRCNLRGA